MSKCKQTKKALLSSVIALILCFSMLLGTTFAWFTDSVESGINKIQAGNLDVELYHTNTKDKDEKVSTSTKLFDEVDPELWEPGAMTYENLEVANEGSLALKYQLAINFANATATPAGKTLADVLKVGVVEGGIKGTTREAVLGEVKSWQTMASFALSSELLAEKSDVYGIVIYWEPSANDNDYNMNNGQTTVLKIDLGVNLFATQEMYEKDSFDDTYDKDTEVFTVAEANAMLAENKDVTLINCIETDGIIRIPADYTGKLILKNSTIASVQADAAANITILGNVVVDASALANTSAITGAELNINGNGNLTAIANGKHAYGIGGNQTTEITIEGVHIVDVKGGYVQPNFEATNPNYGKNEPEGGAAIGSGKDGAVITLNNVSIDNAQGGSKAAGIGALYHTGVTVNINNSVIKNVEGGNASAGIGGSRVERKLGEDAANIAKENVVVNIVNSTINAVGGQYGAGIGSGYDCDCRALSLAPMNTVNIDAASLITAQGGWLAAGIGTGHNVVSFTGNIACDTSNVKAGSSEDPSWCCWGAPCTLAENVGLGVLNTNHFSDLYTGVSNSEKLADAINAGKTVIYLAKGSYKLPNAQYKNVTLIGAGTDTIVDYSHMGQMQEVYGSSFNFKNMTIQCAEVGYPYPGLQHTTSVSYENCHIKGTVNLFCSATFKGCTFDSGNAEHNVVTYSASEVTFEKCDFTYGDRSVNCYSENGASHVANISFTDCTFTKVAGKTTTGAIETNSSNITALNLTINNCSVNEGKLWFVADPWDSLKGAKTTVTVDGKVEVATAEQLATAIANGTIKVLLADGEYDLNGIQKDGLTLIGNGENVKVANTTKYASGKEIGAIWQAINLENVTITNTVYTMADGGKATFKNVNFAAGFRQGYGTGVVFTDCTFGANSEGYALHFQTDSASEGGLITLTGCKFEGGKVHLGGKRSYSFADCEFAAGTDFQVWSNITLNNCTVNGEKITEDNAAAFFPNLNLEKVTIQ